MTSNLRNTMYELFCSTQPPSNLPPPYSATTLPPPYTRIQPQPIIDRLEEIATFSRTVNRNFYGQLIILYSKLKKAYDVNNANRIICGENSIIRVYLPELSKEDIDALFYILRPIVDD